MVLLKTFKNLKTYLQENNEMKEYDREHNVDPAIRKNAIKRSRNNVNDSHYLGYSQVGYSLWCYRFIKLAFKLKLCELGKFIAYDHAKKHSEHYYFKNKF